MERTCRQGACTASLGEHALDKRNEIGGPKLSCAHAYDVPAGIDGNQRGPGANGIGAPHAELAIVQYGVEDAEPNGGIANAGCLTLSRELAAVDADHRDLAREQLLELPQLRKDMNAVDSAVGPEIQQQQLATKVGEREPATARVHPVECIGKLGSADWRSIHGIHGKGGRRHGARDGRVRASYTTNSTPTHETSTR